MFDEVTDREFKKKHSLKVEATVIDLVKNPNTNREFYQPIYEYEVNDVVMEVGALGYYEKRIPKLGDKLIIFVNPEDSVNFVSPSKYENIIPKIRNVNGNINNILSFCSLCNSFSSYLCIYIHILLVNFKII